MLVNKSFLDIIYLIVTFLNCISFTYAFFNELDGSVKDRVSDISHMIGVVTGILLYRVEMMLLK